MKGTRVSRTRVPCEVPESNELEYGIGFFFFFQKVNQASTRVWRTRVLSVIPESAKLGYGSGLFQKRGQALKKKNLQADWYLNLANSSNLWSTRVHQTRVWLGVIFLKRVKLVELKQANWYSSLENSGTNLPDCLFAKK